MDKIIEFLKYIWFCIWGGLGTLTGHVPENFGWKETFVFCIILVVLMAIFFVLCLFYYAGEKKQ